MTPEQAAAYVNAQVACALAEIEAMKRANENYLRSSDTNMPVYTPHSADDFRAVADRFGLGHNTVVQLFNDANQYAGR